jgi:ABC-type transport system involved in multi-copper enzyme maturation permease subunit
MRDATRPLPMLFAARAVFGLSLDVMVLTRRSLLMAGLVGLPVAFALLYRGVLAARIPPQVGPMELYGAVVVLYYVGSVLPLVALFYATSLVADEVEGKTITYLLTRPVPRVAILAGKFAAYLVTTLSLALPCLVLTFLLLTSARRGVLAAAAPELFRDAGVVALTLVSYGALFTLLGVLLKRPLIPGLLFVFVWEWVSKLPGYLPRLTLTAHLRSLLTHRPAEEGLAGLFGQALPAASSVAVLLVASAAFLALALWIFSTREYVIEQ